jgi:DNA-binding transcriptional MocR family regulator
MKLANIIAGAIEDGSLSPGKRLPTHRSIAEKYGVALATATRAYNELESRGLIVGEAGRGMFVRDQGLSRTLGVEQEATEGMIDFVFNMPSDVTDTESLRMGLKRIAASGDLEAMLRYQPHAGRLHERKIIATNLKHTLGETDPNQLLITSGAQHGLALVVLGLLQRGETVATDALTYPGFKSIARIHGINLIPISSTNECMCPNDLERQCRARKLKAIYLMPTVHNPLGTVMDISIRKQLIEVARRHDLLIIEDSAYAFLEPNPPISFFEMAQERTIHVGGFSKNIATGLRLGYLIAPTLHVKDLSHVIRATTWNAPALISALVTGWIEDGTLDRSEENRRRDGAERQQICRDILGELQVVSHPNAGFSWLPLRTGMRAEPIVASLQAKGISASTGEPFSVIDAAPQALRIAFGGISKDELIPAIEMVRDALNTPL